MRNSMHLPLATVLVAAGGLGAAAPQVALAPQLESAAVRVGPVRPGSIAAKAGLKAGDRVLRLDQGPLTGLEQLLAHRAEWGLARDTRLGFAGGGDAVLPQGDWGVEFCPDLTAPARQRLEAATVLLRQPAWQRGERDWRALADQAMAEGARDAGHWLSLQLGEALSAAGQGAAARQEFKAVAERAEPGSYWRFAALLRQAEAAKAGKDPEAGLSALRQAQGEARQGAQELRLASALLAQARLEGGRGQVQQARDAAQAAWTIRTRLVPGSLSAAQACQQLGSFTEDLGDLKLGKAHLLEAAAIQERLAPGSEELAETCNLLAGIAWQQGDMASTLRRLLQALRIHQELAPGSRGLAASYANLGILCDSQGDLPAAKEHLLHALEIFQKLNPEGRECAGVLTNLGLIATSMGDLPAARDFLQRSLAIQERLLPDSLDLARTLNNLGQTATELGDLPAAESYLARAQRIREKLAPGSLDEAFSHSGLGRVALARKDAEAARACHLRALAIRERLAPGSLALVETLGYLAQAETLAGRMEPRLDYLNRAVATLESQRAGVNGEAATATFSAANGRFYSALIAAQVQAKQPERALETLERSRARELLEVMASRNLDFKGEVPEALLERRRALARQRKDLSQRLARADVRTKPKDIEDWRRELLLLDSQDQALDAEMRSASPRLAALVDPSPLDFKGICAALAPGTLLLAYAVAEDETYLFALRKPAGRAAAPVLKTFRLAYGGRDLEQRVKAFRALMTPAAAFGPDPGAWARSARELQAALLPVLGEIRASRRILLLADGPLHLLPFAALAQGPGGSTLDPKPLSLQPSVTVYGSLSGPSRKSSDRAWVGFGEPALAPGSANMGLGPLPGSRQEVQGIAALFGDRATMLLGSAATKEALLALPRRTAYLHFACHGLIDPEQPLNSGLLLSPGPEGAGSALLQSWEILRDLRLDSDCVVLSACATGAGKVYGGEGILGLTRAFFHAGARSAVVSLWPVADAATARLMRAFYREILAGAPRDLALQRAKASLARSADFAHPFFWAAFDLHGRSD